MAFVFQFTPETMSAQQYDECMVRLADAGATSPEGRLSHVCYGPPDRLRVFDVWESRESFDRFGPTLIPILAAIGVDPGAPEIAETHNIV
jgi:hypothetical protein